MFTLVDSGIVDGFGITDQDTDSLLAALGDIFFVGCGFSSSNSGSAASGGGITWADEIGTGHTDVTGKTFRAASGTPATGVLNYSQTNTFGDFGWAVARPADLAWIGQAGKAAAASSALLNIALTTSPAAALLAYGWTHGAVTTWAKDTDAAWIELLDENAGTGGSQTIQYRLSDDSNWDCDPNATDGLLGMVGEFSAAGGADRGAPRGTRRGTQRGVHRMKIENGLWRPLFPGRVIPAGAF